MSNDNNDEFDIFDPQLEEYFADSIADVLEIEHSASLKDDSYGYDVILSQYIYQLKALANKVEPTDCYLVSGSGPAWFYHPPTRDFIKCERGIEIYPIAPTPDKDGNIMVRTANTYLLIPAKDLIKVGYN